MHNAALDAAIELLGKYQAEFQLKAVHLTLAPNGDICVSIAPRFGGNGAGIAYGRIDRFTKRLMRTAITNEEDATAGS